MKRLCVLVFLLLVLGTAPAWAHEEINPATLPVGKPVFLTLTAANEKQVKLTKMTLLAPSGISFGEATRAPTGWTSAKTPTTVTWTGGSVDPDHFESFGFELEGADQPGTLTWKVTLGYADGSSEDASVPVTAVAAGAGGGSASGSGSGNGRANLALALGAAGLALAVVGLVRGRQGGAAPRPAGGEQDW